TLDRADRETARRLMRLLDIGPRRAKRGDDTEPYHQRSDWVWSEAEAKVRGEQIYQQKERERQRDAAKACADSGQPPVPQRAPGESDALFMARLKHHRDAVLDAATADFKAGKFAALRPLSESAAYRQSDNPALKARADAMAARARAEADELAERAEGAAE